MNPTPKKLSILHSPFSILHSPFSILNSQFSILHSPFSILHSPFSILHSQFSILNSPFSIISLLLLLNSPFSILHSQFIIAQQVHPSFTSRHFGIREGLLQANCVAAFQDDNGYLWVSNHDGVSCFDGINFVNYSMKDLHINTIVKNMFQYESAVALISASSIIFVYPDQSMEHYPFPNHYLRQDDVVEVSGDHVYLFNCWVKDAYKRLFRFNLKEKNYTVIADSLPYLLSYTDDGKIYAVTAPTSKNEKKHLYRLDDEKLTKIREIQPGKDEQDIFRFIKTKKNEFTDRENNLWVLTENGFFQYARYVFKSYQLQTGSYDDLSGVFQDSQGNVWFSTAKNLFWRADKQGKLQQITLTSHQNPPARYYGRTGLCEDRNGRVFLPFDNAIAVYDSKNNNTKPLKILPILNSYSSYYDAENDAIFFGGQNNTGSITLNMLSANGNLTSYFSGNPYIMSICRDGNRKLRLGTLYGEAVFDEEKKVVVFDTVAHACKSVICMALDDKGTLWKGGWEGLFAEDKTGNLRQITDKITVFVLNYQNKYIIYGIKNQLYILDLQSYYSNKKIEIRTFGYYDGFDVMECKQNGASIDHEGFVWVAGGDRVIRFHPDEIMKMAPLQPFPPCLAAVYYADKTQQWILSPQTSSMQFENSNNNLRFELLQASLSAPDKLIFRYRLLGYSDQWLTSRERTLVFQNLSFGKYQLEVQSSVDEERWSESVFSPVITIKNPFFLTFAGLLLIFLGISGIGACIIYFTRKISIRKETEKREIEQLKYRAVRGKFIPHFTGNVLNSINYLITKNPESAQRYIADYADFLHKTLFNSDSLERTIQEELDYAELYLKLEKLRFEEKVEYEFSVNKEVDLSQPVPTMVLHTFCENAIKHGLRPKPKGGKITVSVKKQANCTVLSVEDNGVGRAKAKTLNTEGTKEGMKIVQQQIDLFNKGKNQKADLQIVDLHDTEQQPTGTRFELRI